MAEDGCQVGKVKICDMDLSGQKFNMLTAIERVKKEKGCMLWKCQCQCGGETIARANELMRGAVKSCGCIVSKRGREMLIRMNTTHGLYDTRLYGIRRNMLQRCYNPKSKRYAFYGGKGVTVCEEWKNEFMSFYKWALGNGYQEGLTIDRIDVDGNYEPSNCRWATLKEQSQNTSRSIKVDYFGSQVCLKEASRLCGMSYETLRFRYKNGLRGEKLFTNYKYRKGEVK